jgi:hypothetical protein
VLDEQRANRTYRKISSVQKQESDGTSGKTILLYSAGGHYERLCSAIVHYKADMTAMATMSRYGW